MGDVYFDQLGSQLGSQLGQILRDNLVSFKTTNFYSCSTLPKIAKLTKINKTDDTVKK